ncbi:hypothetical protein KR200_005730 [Drosophila serrata]|nr:hypothetical protein KR200_005730 [Drosophila serrata]
MASSKLFLLLIGLCCLTPMRETHAECCTTFDQLTFTMENGSCDIVGGHGDTICNITICADGVAMKGVYCGRGPCNIFGCNCDGGCITGEWTKSFLEKNHQYGIKIILV